MATSRWRSSIANVETRIRRSLGLAGPIGTDLPDPLQISPVMIVDDATRPGSAAQRGRRFSFVDHVEDLEDAQPCWMIYNDSPTGVILSKFQFCVSGGVGLGAHVSIEQFPAGADLSAFAALNTFARDGHFIERSAGPTDLAPLWAAYAASGFMIPATATPVWSLHVPNESNSTAEVTMGLYLAPPPAPGLTGGAVLVGLTTDQITGRMGTTIFGEVY